MAFGAERLLLVGQGKYSSHGAHGSDKHIRTKVFASWEALHKELGTTLGCHLVGLVAEVPEEADLPLPPVPVSAQRFLGPTVFVVPLKVQTYFDSCKPFLQW